MPSIFLVKKWVKICWYNKEKARDGHEDRRGDSIMEQLRTNAENIAVEVGDWIRKQWANIKKVDLKSNHTDLVTNIDRKSEELIMKKIKERYIHHHILSEEQANGQNGFSILASYDDYCWVIDPLDGTMNFVHNISHYAVSIAVMKNGDPIVGVIYEPNRRELFSAEKGKGAFLNGQPIQVSKQDRLEDSLLHTGFCAPDWNVNSSLQSEFQKGYGRCRYIRITGSSALDLAYVASGRIDGFWQRGLSPWDIAAGVLLVEEAGGRVSGIKNEDYRMKDGNMIASNSKIHLPLYEMLNKD